MKKFDWNKLNIKNLSYKQIVLAGVLAGIILGIILYFIIAIFFQGDINQTIDRWVTEYQYENSPTMEQVEERYDYPELNLDPAGGILIDSMLSDWVDVSAANREDTALLTEVADNQDEEQSPEDLPWYYFSPLVEQVSPYSYANQYRLTEATEINQFRWLERDEQSYLAQGDELFTGWHNEDLETIIYYQDGLPTDNQLSVQFIESFILHHRIVDGLIGSRDYDPFFVERRTDYQNFYLIYPYEYSILFKNPESIILTAPPGTKGSTLVTNTQNYIDMPLEVVGEYRSYSDEWLHVYIGYEELGWIRKDDDFNDYVLTYYSERELLDTIEQVLIEEISYINADVGASFINNETMAQVDVNSHSFFPASTQKIYVLGELFHQYKTGELSPWDTRVMTAWDKVPGAGIIQGHPDGSVYTLDELVNLVVLYSDNTAANMLIDAVGGGAWINPHLQQMGLYDTYIYGKYYQGDSYLTTTPNDAARYFALLYNDRLNGAPYDEQLINKFLMNSHTYLRQYTPYTGTNWNKSGVGGTEQNDVATFVTPYGSYSIAVYTAYPANRAATADAVGMLSLRVYNVFNEIRQQLWTSVEDPDDYMEEIIDTQEAGIENQ